MWNLVINYINCFFLPLFRKSPLISSQDFYPSAEVYLSALSRLVLTTLAIVIWIASLQDTQFAYIPNELANTISPYFQVSAFLDKTLLEELANMGAIWPILSNFGGGLGHKHFSFKLAKVDFVLLLYNQARYILFLTQFEFS